MLKSLEHLEDQLPIRLADGNEGYEIQASDAAGVRGSAEHFEQVIE